jgi:hypothetical protein
MFPADEGMPFEVDCARLLSARPLMCVHWRQFSAWIATSMTHRGATRVILTVGGTSFVGSPVSTYVNAELEQHPQTL